MLVRNSTRTLAGLRTAYLSVVSMDGISGNGHASYHRKHQRHGAAR